MESVLINSDCCWYYFPGKCVGLVYFDIYIYVYIYVHMSDVLIPLSIPSSPPNGCFYASWTTEKIISPFSSPSPWFSPWWLFFVMWVKQWWFMTLFYPHFLAFTDCTLAPHRALATKNGPHAVSSTLWEPTTCGELTIQHWGFHDVELFRMGSASRII